MTIWNLPTGPVPDRGRGRKAFGSLNGMNGPNQLNGPNDFSFSYLSASSSWDLLFFFLLFKPLAKPEKRSQIKMITMPNAKKLGAPIFLKKSEKCSIVSMIQFFNQRNDISRLKRLPLIHRSNESSFPLSSFSHYKRSELLRFGNSS